MRPSTFIHDCTQQGRSPVKPEQAKGRRPKLQPHHSAEPRAGGCSRPHNIPSHPNRHQVNKRHSGGPYPPDENFQTLQTKLPDVYARQTPSAAASCSKQIKLTNKSNDALETRPARRTGHGVCARSLLELGGGSRGANSICQVQGRYIARSISDMHVG